MAEKKKIIFVDDDDIARKIIADMAGMLNIKADIFESGEEALEKFRLSKESYFLAIIDYGLKGFSGGDLADAIKGIDNDFPIVLISGNIDLVDKKALNFNYLFQKPFGISQFKMIIDETLKEGL